MKADDLFNAITNLRDDQVEAAKPRPRLRRIAGIPAGIPAAIAACLAVCVIIAIATGFPKPEAANQTMPLHTGNIRLATAVYPALKKPAGTDEASGEDNGDDLDELKKASGAVGPYADTEESEAYTAEAAGPAVAEDSAEAAAGEPAGMQAFWEDHDQARSEYNRMRCEYQERLSSFWLEAAGIYLDPAYGDTVDLLGTESGNRIFSPMELTIALGMTAEITTGPGQQEILDLLGSPNIGDLRQTVKRLWHTAYTQDENCSLLLASSIWLRDDTDYRQEVLDVLARDYYADSFAGTMGTDEYNALRRDWIDEKTNGFLAELLENPESAELPAGTNMALTGTTYYKAGWISGFDRKRNVEKAFRNADGEYTTTFMCEDVPGVYYCGERFGAVSKALLGGSRMLFILPDEGVSTTDLLGDSQCRDFMTYFLKYNGTEPPPGSSPCQENRVEILLEVPKFDVTFSTDLADGLKRMGVQTVFDFESRSFTPLTERQSAYQAVPQSCRFKLDEEGCEAASVTTAVVAGAGMAVEDIVEFTLDRPFLFLLVSDQGLPVYIGMVNNPTA